MTDIKIQVIRVFSNRPEVVAHVMYTGRNALRIYGDVNIAWLIK